MDQDIDNYRMETIYDLANLEGDIFSDAWSVKTLESTFLQEYVYTVIVFKSDESLIMCEYRGGKCENARRRNEESGEWEEIKKVKYDKLNACGYLFSNIIGDEAELLKIAVDTDCRGKGIGRAIMKTFDTYIEEKKCTNSFLEVRAGNQSAINLYNKFGYRQISVRKDYYTYPTEDGLILKKEIHS